MVGTTPPRHYSPKTCLSWGHGDRKGSLNRVDLSIQGELPRLLKILTKGSPPFILIQKTRGGQDGYSMDRQYEYFSARYCDYHGFLSHHPDKCSYPVVEKRIKVIHRG